MIINTACRDLTSFVVLLLKWRNASAASCMCARFESVTRLLFESCHPSPCLQRTPLHSVVCRWVAVILAVRCSVKTLRQPFSVDYQQYSQGRNGGPVWTSEERQARSVRHIMIVK